MLYRCALALLLATSTTPSYAQELPAPMPRHLPEQGYVWMPQLSPQGPTTIVVSLEEQRAYVYRNGVRIGVTKVSTGKVGHETPTGVFTILEKHREHYSNRYDNAPMPLHGARYVDPGLATQQGRLGRSYGYPALRPAVARQMIDTLKQGQLLFAYYPDRKWLAHSRFLDCPTKAIASR